MNISRFSGREWYKKKGGGGSNVSTGRFRLGRCTWLRGREWKEAAVDPLKRAPWIDINFYENSRTFPRLTRFAGAWHWKKSRSALARVPCSRIPIESTAPAIPLSPPLALNEDTRSEIKHFSVKTVCKSVSNGRIEIVIIDRGESMFRNKGRTGC